MKHTTEIPKPTDDMPEVYRDMLTETETKSLPNLPKVSIEDLEKLGILKLKLKSLKQEQKQDDVSTVLNDVIEYLDIDAEQNKREVFLYVMWKLERFYLKPKSGAEKKAMATSILKRLFHDDEYDTGLYIESLMKEKEFKQIKTVGRVGLKLFRFFLGVK